MKETDATSSPANGVRSSELPVTTLSEESHSKNQPALHESHQRSSEDGGLQRAHTARDEETPVERQALATVSTAGPVHSVFTKGQKRFIVVMASFGGFFSPVSASIYLPALNALAKDLGVTSTLINLTLTSYMVCESGQLSSRRQAQKTLSRFSKVSRPLLLAISQTVLVDVRHTQYVLSSTSAPTLA